MWQARGAYWIRLALAKRSNCLASLAKADGARGPRHAHGECASGPANKAVARPLTWSEAETMDILEDDDMMASIAEGREDVKAGRLVEWKPGNATNAQPT